MKRVTICYLPDAIIYFGQQGLPAEMTRKFYDHYNHRSWKTMGGTAVTDWKCFARAWIKKERLQR